MNSAESFSAAFSRVAPSGPAEADALRKIIRQHPYFDAARWLQALWGGAEDPSAAYMSPAARLWLGRARDLKPSAASGAEEVMTEAAAHTEQGLEAGPEQLPSGVVAEPAAERPSPIAPHKAEEDAETSVSIPKEAGAMQTEFPIQQLHTQDYFEHTGITAGTATPPAPPADLMVVRTFSDWMAHFQKTTREAEAEAQSQRALRALRQREKLALASGEDEEDEEIPEEVFQMAVASIAADETASEPLAEILVRQGKWERAIDMYGRLRAANPSKSAYFAAKIEAVEQRKAE